MASGDTLLILMPQHCSPPGTTFATFDTVTGTSTPAERIPVLDFNDTNQQYADFYCVMPQNYDGGGLTCIVGYSAAETSTDVIDWEIAIRAVPDDAEDLDTTAHTYQYNDVVDTAPSAVGEVGYATITFTDGADMDSVAAGEYFILRLTRDPTPNSGTDVTGDASMHFVHVKET